MSKSKIIIVGGGASGIIAAIIASRNKAKVTIIERKDRIGKKILATGNGQCNISNKYPDLKCYHTDCKDKLIIEQILNEFDVHKTKQFFEEIGINIIEKNNGKLYPRSLQASSVLNALILELEKLKVNIVTDTEVKDIQLDKNFKVITNDKVYYGNKVIIAAGGRSNKDLGSNGSGFKLAEKLNHTITTIVPSLVQLETDYNYLKHLQGTKIIGIISILDENENILRKDNGEILFTNYGVSGPPVLQISRIAAKRLIDNLVTYITIDLVPEYTYDELDKYLINRFNMLSNRSAEQVFIGFIHNRIIIPILKENNISIHKKACDITKNERIKLINTLKNLKMKVIKTRQWNQSQVTAGGVSLDEVTIKLESKIIPNLYFCGEVLDVDGDCGGYNLQWAWSSGAVAGQNASLN